jgi:prepilin-type N-terminal cleavage/methylation domain-containing protein
MSIPRKVPDMFTHSEDCGQYDRQDPRTPAGARPVMKKKPLGDTYRRLRFRASRATCGGFSLVELLASIVVVSVIMAAIVSAISQSEQAYGSIELQSDMYENVRGAAELMAQEVGQAGVLSLPASTLSAGVAASGTAQAVTVSSTTSMYAGAGQTGEAVLVDAGSANEELVYITAITGSKITAIFTKAHALGAPITVLGVFPNGIVVPGTTDGSTSNAGAAVSTLNLFGDINADGSLVYVRYTCDTSVTPGTLTRSVTTITPGSTTISAAQTLLSTLIPNPATTAYPTGVPCFQFTTQTVGTPSNTFVTNVGLTISVRSLKADPRTGAYLTMTKSFLDLAPRNLLAGYELANAALNTRLQATPSNVTAY